MKPKEASGKSKVVITGQFARPEDGICFKGKASTNGDVVARGLPGWQSNGGDSSNPAWNLPFNLETFVPEQDGELVAVHLIGIFALYSQVQSEGPGTIGASVQLFSEDRLVFRENLLNGKHYSDSTKLAPAKLPAESNFVQETIGKVNIQGTAHRVDHVRISIPPHLRGSRFVLKDLASPCSFVIFEIYFEFDKLPVCPFRARTGGVSLNDLPSIIRVGDRLRFNRAVSQLSDSLLRSDDLDEARSVALTFLAVTTAATLEMGGKRELHRVQLDAARQLESATTPQQASEIVLDHLEVVAGPLLGPKSSPSERLVERALALVEKSFMQDLSDEMVAHQLNMSTSHFRFLFKKISGQPFHKYLMSVRLEKARKMLLEGNQSVSAVAESVGFSGLSHFSRVFTQRFNVSPTSIRRQTGQP